VVVNLPRLADVIGYEERDKATMSLVRTGYPRFLRHPLVSKAVHCVAEAAGISAARHEMFPVASEAAALLLVKRLHLEACSRIVPASAAGSTRTPPGSATGHATDDGAGWALLCVERDAPDSAAHRTAKYTQHTGLQISSRRAEDWLHARGLVPAPAPEALDETIRPDNAACRLQDMIAPWMEPATPADITPCPSGMNAFHAALEAARAVQRAAGRRTWLQLGWLYTDTSELLRKSLRPGEHLEIIHDALDRQAIEECFARNGTRLAGVVTETPTNPLLCTADLPHLRALADGCGALLLLDPSTGGLPNTRALPFADILAVSLTKYAAPDGDVMLGALAVNPARPHANALAGALRKAGQSSLAPVHWRDAARLGFEMRGMEEVAALVNANTPRLVEWLSSHPRVQRVRWAFDATTARNYARIARAPGACGGLVSINLNGDFATFHDRMRAVKGPSFGTRFTIVSPYVYMAHYDLVRDATRHDRMRALGLHPELIRISVGAEPFDEIRAAFAEALDA
jgi:cystathionine gamma-synthase